MAHKAPDAADTPGAAPEMDERIEIADGDAAGGPGVVVVRRTGASGQVPPTVTHCREIVAIAGDETAYCSEAAGESGYCPAHERQHDAETAGASDR